MRSARSKICLITLFAVAEEAQLGIEGGKTEQRCLVLSGKFESAF